VGAARGKGMEIVPVNGVNLGCLDQRSKMSYREIGQMDVGV
jgi:hypothetical protein